MVDSELYEDAQSKIDFHSKSNSMSMYQDAQSKINNYSKKITSKRSESSIYQDAQSRITNNSRISSNRHKNSISKISSGKNNIVNKNDFLKINNIYKDDKLENNEEEKIKSRNLIAQKKYEEDKIEDINNNNEDNKSEILYEVENDEKKEEAGKTLTIFEGMTKKGECCNLPKCFIF